MSKLYRQFGAKIMGVKVAEVNQKFALISCDKVYNTLCISWKETDQNVPLTLTVNNKSFNNEDTQLNLTLKKTKKSGQCQQQ